MISRLTKNTTSRSTHVALRMSVEDQTAELRLSVIAAFEPSYRVSNHILRYKTNSLVIQKSQEQSREAQIEPQYYTTTVVRCHTT